MEKNKGKISGTDIPAEAQEPLEAELEVSVTGEFGE